MTLAELEAYRLGRAYTGNNNSWAAFFIGYASGVATTLLTLVAFFH